LADAPARGLTSRDAQVREICDRRFYKKADSEELALAIVVLSADAKMGLAKRCPAHHRSKLITSVRELYARLEGMGYHQRCDYLASCKLSTAEEERMWEFRQQVRPPCPVCSCLCASAGLGAPCNAMPMRSMYVATGR
jgi:hypothetical protein